EQAQHRRESEEPAQKAPGVNRPPPNQTNDHRDDPANQDQPGDLQKEARTESLVLVARREGAFLLSCHLCASMTFAGPRETRVPGLESASRVRDWVSPG